MSIRGRIASLEKAIAARRDAEAADRPFHVTFCTLHIVDKRSKRFNTWKETEQPGAVNSPRLTYGGAVTFYASNAKQFNEMVARYEQERGGRALCVKY